MVFWKRFQYKLHNFIQPDRAEQDLAREIASHLECLQDDFESRGMSADEAWLAAKRAYGRIEQAKELHRETRSWLWLEQVRQDLRFSIRSMRNSLGFSLATVLTLALGIGANTAIFSLIDAVMLRVLPVSHPQQLMQVNMAKRDIWGVENPFFSNPVWEQLRERQDVFSGVFGYAVGRFDLSLRGEAKYVQGNYVSGQFFETLGLRPVVGRVITTADDRRGCPGIAVLSYGFWQREYGGTGAAGTTISLDHHPFEIIGVIGPGFNGVEIGRKSDIYVPLCADKIIAGGDEVLDNGRGGWLRVMGRPKGEIRMQSVEARLKALIRPILKATMPPNITARQRELYLKRTIEVQAAGTGLSSIRSKYRRALMVLMGIAGVILLIACSNVANFLLARGAKRQREIAIRMALGSGRGRLIRQLLIESLLLSLSGAAVGILLAHWGARLLVKLLVSNVYQESQVFLDLITDLRVLGFTAGVAVLTGLLFGLAPAWRATRLDPQWAMKTNMAAVASGGKFRLSKVLLIIQVTLSLVLVTSAGLLLATFVRLQTLDPGFDRRHVLLMNVDLSQRANTPARRTGAFTQVLDQLRTLPGVRSVSDSDTTPLGGAVDASYLLIDGQAQDTERELVLFNQVGGQYFGTLGMRFLGGRDFNAHDTVGSRKVAICNEAFARKYFHGESPIGRHYRPAQGDTLGDAVEIIGLVRNTKYLDLREDFHPVVYVAESQNANPGRTLTFELLSSGGSTTAMILGAKRVVGTVDPDASLQFRTLAGQVDESLGRERLLAMLSGFFGAVALLLALLGLYGVVSYKMASQRKEIGIRMALGAQQSRVLRTVMGEVVVLMGIGMAIGLTVTIGATHLLASFLYGVRATDARMFSLAATTLATVTVIAAFLPAYKASRQDPMETLREE